ncbi:MAG: single-stranded DNA-binding protein [Oscillospiraceae bacterium]|nr:single-stranded DNA-binding protein [Oscillospiraceae bacterium]
MSNKRSIFVNGKGDNIIFLKLGGVDRFDKDQAVLGKIRLHTAAVYSQHLIAEQFCPQHDKRYLAAQRRYNRSDYLPVIVWGARAREAADWKVGDRVELSGRLQMRKYIKNENGIETEKTAYEISASEISLME